MKDDSMRMSALRPFWESITFVCVLSVLAWGCSSLMTVSAFVPQSKGRSWTIDSTYPFRYPRSGGIDFYSCKFICGIDSLQLDVVFLGGWTFWGPPVVPLVPVPVGSQDALSLNIWVTANDGDSTRRPPNIALRVLQTGESQKPSRVESWGRSRPFHHVNGHDSGWSYRFEVRLQDLSDFQIEFLDPYLGCQV